MKTMQPLLPLATRLAMLAAGTAIAATGWIAASHESHRAVQVALAPAPVYVTLPRVEIVAKRAVPAETALAAAANAHNEL